ncbi:hypothetical protein DL769_006525 [Monosporascus sp. CRB-8-3]|nr:hypothetical protein DL769_006525 [Monosporascus sp. CRB-8-3]
MRSMPSFTFRALLGSLCLDPISAIPVDLAPETRRSAAAAASEAGLSVTDNHRTLTRVRRPPGLLRAVDTLRQNRKKKQKQKAGEDDEGEDEPEGVDSLRTELNQVEYLTRVGVGGREFLMIPDTSSSDTWMVREGFRCLVPWKPARRSSSEMSPLTSKWTDGSVNIR